MKEFYTRQTANDGLKLPLVLPDGSPSDHWLNVRGIDSDEFRKADSIAKRKAMEISLITDVNERAENVREVELQCIAALISSWSFPMECTVANVVDFLREAPQVADAVNRYSARRAEYFTKKSLSSAIGQSVKSSSKGPRKAQKSNSETT